MLWTGEIQILLQERQKQRPCLLLLHISSCYPEVNVTALVFPGPPRASQCLAASPLTIYQGNYQASPSLKPTHPETSLSAHKSASDHTFYLIFPLPGMEVAQADVFGLLLAHELQLCSRMPLPLGCSGDPEPCRRPGPLSAPSTPNPTVGKMLPKPFPNIQVPYSKFPFKEDFPG